jgi:hypothetical protein
MKQIIIFVLILTLTSCRATPTFSDRCFLTELSENDSPYLKDEFINLSQRLNMRVDLQHPRKAASLAGELNNRKYELIFHYPSKETRGEISLFFNQPEQQKEKVLLAFDQFISKIASKNIKLTACKNVPGYEPSTIYR